MKNCIKTLSDLTQANCDKGITDFIGAPLSSFVYNSLKYEKLYTVINKTIQCEMSLDIGFINKIIDNSLNNLSPRVIKRLKGINNSIVAEETSSKYKADTRRVEALIRSVLYSQEGDEIITLSYPRQDGECSTCIFSEDHMKYCPYRFVWVQITDTEECQFRLSRKEFNFPEMADITRTVIRVLYLIKDYNKELIRNRDLVRLILSPITTYIQFFESMNPVGNSLKNYCINLIQSLTDKDCQPSSPGDNKYFLDTLNKIEADLLAPIPLNYIKNLYSIYSLLHQKIIPFSDKDYYLSYKATPKIVNYNDCRKRLKSLPSSAFEDDPIKDLPWVIAFDNQIGYKSYYSSNPLTSGPEIITTEIENPGKFKTRGIHYACNAIQDRCSYIHNRLMDIENFLPESCIKNQFKGVQFLIWATKSWLKFKEEDDGPSLYNFDFTNATDTLDQEISRRVVSLFLGDIIGNFFYEISRYNKVFSLKTKNLPYDIEIPYRQEFGQPQGLLGSFDAFNLTHYLIMLGVMKNCHLESILSSNFFRILGDDSAIYTYIPDKEGIIKDEYVRLAKSCNLKLNEDKSNFVYYNNKFANIDFAKVSVTNGEIDSPIPYRLLTKFDNKQYQFSTAFWLLDKRISYGPSFLKAVLDIQFDQNFSDWINYLISQGLTPYYKINEDLEMTPFLLLSSTILVYSIMMSNLVEKNTPHDDRLTISIEELDKGLSKGKIPVDITKFYDQLNPGHKINILRGKNIILTSLLKKIHHINDVDNAFDLLYCLYSNQILKGIDPNIIVNILNAIGTLTDIKDQDSFENWFRTNYIPYSTFRKILNNYTDEAIIIRDISSPKRVSVAYTQSYKILKELVLSNPRFMANINLPLFEFSDFTVQLEQF